MKQASRLIVLCILVLFIPFCKKEQFTESEQVFRRWSSSLKNLSYTEYKACEAYPKEEGVFREIYRYTYYTECAVREFDDLKQNKVKKDSNGNTYLDRKVYFDCAEVKREAGKRIGSVRGEVTFVKFLDSDRSKDGWLMWNRTLYRIEQ